MNINATFSGYSNSNNSPTPVKAEIGKFTQVKQRSATPQEVSADANILHCTTHTVTGLHINYFARARGSCWRECWIQKKSEAEVPVKWQIMRSPERVGAGVSEKQFESPSKSRLVGISRSKSP